MVIKKIPPRGQKSVVHVAAYCRVSTLQDRQEDSFETQKRYYTEMIQAHPHWELADIYADRRSATSAKNRPGFQKMLADAQDKKIDRILCKSVSRFARNVVDCQTYTRWLATLGVAVIFEEQNLRTDDAAGSFALSMLSAVAQDESHSISKNVRAGYESRYARGEYNLGNNRILGYDSINGKLVPNREAWIIQEIYNGFLEGKTYREIEDSLQKMGAKTLRGKERFSAEAIRYILTNETYAGDKLLQKQPPRDYLTKKPDPNCVLQQKYLQDDHEGIIDRETWNAVQEILAQCREKAQSNR